MKSPSATLAISPLQLAALLVLSRIESASVLLPSVSVSPCPRDAWIVAGAGVLMSVPPLLVLGWLSLRHGGGCLVSLSRRLLGRPLGSSIGLFLGAFFLLCAACTTRHVVEAYTGVFMTETPGLIFSASIVLVAVYAAFGGSAVLGRAGSLVLAVAVPLLILTTVLPLNTMRLRHLQPVLDASFTELAAGSLISFSFSMQAIAGAMLLPYLKPRTPKSLGTVLIVYAALSLVTVSAGSAAVVASYGETSGTLVFPLLSLARRVKIAEFIERIEVLPVTAWTASACLRIALFLWAGASSIAKSLGLRRGRELILPLGYLCVASSSLLVKNVFEMLRFYQWDVWGVYGTVVQLGLVVLLVSAYLVRTAFRRKPRERT